MAGYEVEPQRVRGRPIGLAAGGWAVSVALGLGIAAVLQATGLVLSALYVGLPLATTALGPLLPILRDEGVLETRFGAYVLAAGTVGEFGPVVAVTLLLSARQPSLNALLLVLFAAAAVAIAVLAVRWHPPQVVRLVRETMQTSAQLAVRLSLLLLITLVLLAFVLNLDVPAGRLCRRHDRASCQRRSRGRDGRRPSAHHRLWRLHPSLLRGDRPELRPGRDRPRPLDLPAIPVLLVAMLVVRACRCSSTGSV